MLASRCWGLDHVRAVHAWHRTRGRDARVAIVDTHIANHPAIEICERVDVRAHGGGHDPSHGVSIAAIVQSVAPEASLIAVTIAPPLNVENAARGIHAAVSRGAHVINASWRFDLPHIQLAPLRSAIGRAGDAGVLVVVAAGNGGKNMDVTPEYPACWALDNVIAVAGHWPAQHDRSFDPLRLVPTSNHGKGVVHLAAPGDGIWTAVNSRAGLGDSHGFADRCGTSFAAPFVSGAAALLRSLNPNWRAPELRAHLLANARASTTPRGRTATDGWLDVERAVLRA